MKHTDSIRAGSMRAKLRRGSLGRFKAAAAAVLCALSLALSLPAAAAPDTSYRPRSRAAQELLQHFKNPQFWADNAASASFMPGLEGKRRAVYIERINELYASEGVAEYLVRELEAAGFFNADLAGDSKSILLYVWPLMDNLMSRGMLRLDDEMLKTGFKGAYGLCRQAGARTCAAMFSGSTPVDKQAVIHASAVYLNECPQPEFDAYLGLICASIAAEVNDYPPLRQLTMEEVQLAQQVLLNLLRAFYEEDPVACKRLIEVLDAPQNFYYQVQYAAAQDYYKLVLKAQGQAGSLLRRYLLSLNAN